jgi:hypothetical protein
MAEQPVEIPEPEPIVEILAGQPEQLIIEEAKDDLAMQANKFEYRYSDPCGGIIKHKQNRHFPAIDKLSYDNYLVSINEVEDGWEFQFTLLDGANCGSGGSDNNWTSLKIS